MKQILILCVLFFAGAFAAPSGEDHRWNLVPDSEGRLHLVDLNPIDIQEPEPMFNPNTDVHFILFTRRNPTSGQRLLRTTASHNGSNWSSTAGGTRFVIHGWLGNSRSAVNIEMTRAHLAHSDHNVIVVHWENGANSLNYATSRGRVPDVAQVTASYIDWLHQNNYLVNFNRLIITGHSLGAHIAGLTGKRVSRGRVEAIFGLDPAGPLFLWTNPTTRLASGDAMYTEMIATNAGGLGFDRPLCHGTFYPNWGESQPGCIGDTCSHNRVIDLMAESVNSARFNARRCADWDAIQRRSCPIGQGTGVMGGNARKTLSGVFWLTTNSRSPFAQG